MAKILLVEDDNNLREIFEMRLKAEGYTIVTAHDGEQALVVAMQEKPDLVISDVMMPKLSGFEMVETLKAASEMKNIKVIMMTALGQAEDRSQGDRLGVNRYLVKSQVTLEDFVRVTKEVLEGEPEQDATAAAVTPEADPPTELPPAAAPADEPPADPPAAPEPVTEPADDSNPIASSAPADAPVSDTPPDDQAAPEPPAAAPADEPPADPPAAPEPVTEPADDSNPIASSTDAQPASATLANLEEPTVLHNPEPADPPAAPTEAVPAQATSADELREVEDQIKNFEANVPETDAPSAPVAPAQPPADPPAAPEPASAPEVVETNVPPKVAGKRVIQPLQGEDKPDLNELLAKESESTPTQVAGSDQLTDAGGNIIPIAEAPGPAAAPTEKKSDVDPNSVAL